ncbi:lipase family alpha/beta hydrolase [Agitococcus lubricus]|uniref:Triacylglycerol lipase n=1 Tax=Agitococcus lubricus TaxID=1077255 RepID=A0A2T5J1N9_9GAMM|nr:triacylglycerol lipase [Agitococcus lubricus]PTQ90361.1 triacylglycerol lipase [Agitococcus lubricus]
MLKHAIAVATLVGTALTSANASAFCLFNCDYTKTKHPIVLAPGVLGFEKLLGFADYWYGIPSALRDGGAKVYTTSASAFNSSEARGEQLLAQVQTILAVSGAQKVNLMGHSHGGFSVRYVASAIPTKVASVTTVHSPVKGVNGAAILTGTDGTIAGSLVQTVGTAVSGFITFLAGNDYKENFMASMKSLDPKGAAAFNAKHPNGVPTTACGEGAYTTNGIKNYSWSGTSAVTNVLDPLDTFFGVMSLVSTSEANDGLVGKCVSHFGKVIRDNYPHNHGDAINQLFGVRGLFTPAPTDLYREHANRLKVAGL